jgi:hypothetical protein
MFQKSGPGHVYLLYCPRLGLYKIGMTHDVESVDQRFRQINGAFPHQLLVVASRRFQNAAGVEVELHKRFKDVRVGGEWFALQPGDAALARHRLKYDPTDEPG